MNKKKKKAGSQGKWEKQEKERKQGERNMWSKMQENYRRPNEQKI